MNMKKMIDAYGAVMDIPNQIINIQNNIAKIWNEMYNYRSKEVKEKHFVLVLIEAERITTVRKDAPNFDYGGYSLSPLLSENTLKIERCTTADSKFITGSHDGMFRIQPNYDMRKLRINIFADFSKVKIDHIKCCNYNLSATYENSPIAYFEGTLAPSNVLTIECSVR